MTISSMTTMIIRLEEEGATEEEVVVVKMEGVRLWS
jgi:hypothetical protein